MRYLLLSLLLLSLPLSSMARVFQNHTHYNVCFTPQQNCTGELVRVIDQAQNSIYVQAYSFTSHEISDALVRAHKRGVKVYIILDKSNFTPKAHTSAYYVMRHDIPVWDDYTLNIAHNKVMIFDKKTIETGSFNYSWSAQKYNAENMLFITNSALAKAYLHNWYMRQEVSTPMDKMAKNAPHS